MPVQITDQPADVVLSTEKPVRVYRGATVVDGTGGPRCIADVAVEGTRVVAIVRAGETTRLVLPADAVEVDAAGLVLAPGFIDMHGAVVDGTARSAKIRHGVTTEVLGRGGLDHPPLDGASVANVAVLVRHGDLRMVVLGQENRPAAPDEVAAMQQMLGEALDGGAFGMSSELPCTPGTHAHAAELEALCRVVAERGGHWAAHARSSGGRALDAWREALDIGRRTGCPVHLTRAAMDAAPDGERVADLVALVDAAIADGLDVTLDAALDAAGRERRDGRESGLLSLEEAVRHLSGAPAARLGLDLSDAPRGVVRAGATADLVLFDPETVSAGALFETPRENPSGVVEVLVGGVPVVRDGEITGAMAGAALRMAPPPHRATVPRVDGVVRPDAAPFEWTSRTPVRGAVELAGSVARLTGTGRPDTALPGVALVVDPALAEDAAFRGRIGDEAFRVTVAADGVEIRGATAAGVFRGATVLRQLRAPEAESGRVPAGVWQGAPAHGWRGTMLDVARHFRPAADLRRLVDLLADHHLNVLHLHLTDDQGWRFAVPGYPRLVEVGARRAATQRGHGPLATVEPGVHEGHYTDAELHELIAYAAERFVTIVPEVELPGHIQAALAAYPELGNRDAADPVVSPWERFGVNPRTLAPTEASLAFGRAAIDALCDLFDSPWIGIGGDEVPVTEWARSAAAGERMRELGLATPHDVQPWFTAQFVAHVRQRGRRALAWDEVLEGDVPEGVEVLAWRGPVAMRESLRRGIPVIACPDLEAYLDYPQSESAEEPIRVGPPLSLERAYSFRVEEGAAGGQANVWTEHLPTRDRLDFAMFPRLSAIAERLWDGGVPGPYPDFARRLPVQLRRLAAAGVRYRPLDGPTPAQRRPGVPGKPLTVEAREVIVAGLVARLIERSGAPS